MLSPGWEDSAWFEHKMIAEGAGLPLVQTQDLSVREGVLYRHLGRDAHRIDVLYARMDEDMLLSSVGFDEQALRPGLMGAIKAGTLTIANALGNGVGDDKAVYAYVPALIEYFLGEKAILEQVPTYLCAERAQRDRPRPPRFARRQARRRVRRGRHHHRSRGQRRRTRRAAGGD